ncbi:alpha/beta hydrolase [Agrilactobacillus yilanensis]|uniref:Alpha/beta hydrolase n=1 Tax=Agrilactobacillus yilanensis TaxID=2485997 RepID=A0ABW4J6Z6_9LACO|nr:alpha/beta hydrolase [Agrilactobacillus yilanensis]
MRIFEINQNSVNRVCLIPNLTYQNTAFWFDQTRRDWQLDLLLPFDYAQQPAHPVIIWLSGGSWQMMDRQSYLPELTFLARAGYVVASMDYHLGAQGAFPMQIKDVRQALAYLKTQQAIYHLDLNQVTLMGDSAGGHLALLRQQTATKAQLQAASPIHYVQANLPRTLLLQGDADQWVPFEQALYLTQALQAAGNQAELFKLNQGQHVDPRFFAPVINQNVLAFLQNK